MTSKQTPSYDLTFEDAIEVHALLADRELQSRIAARFDVNQGRVSEIKSGKRQPGSFAEYLRRKRAG